jgi:hypothetical protein
VRFPGTLCPPNGSPCIDRSHDPDAPEFDMIGTPRMDDPDEPPCGDPGSTDGACGGAISDLGALARII